MSAERKRKTLILLSLIAILLLSRNTFGPFKSFNSKLLKYTPWKVLLAGYTLHYFLSNLLDIAGLGSTDYPEHHYHPDFANVRKVFTGLDAGIVSTLDVRPKWLRDTLSVVLGAYYILLPKKAEDRMHRFHQNASIEGIRACWEKGRHPLLWAITKMKQRSLINLHRRQIMLDPIKILHMNARNEQNIAPIETYLYFQGTDEELAKCRQCIINYPGGGFVAMNHLHHESYIVKWSNYLHIPIIAVNYRKAPEHQYPAGFNDAYYTYKCIVQTKGAILGMKLGENENIRVALSGDSAGGNFVATVCCRAIVEEIQIPDGLLMAYPVLDLNMNLFRPINDALDYKRNLTNTIMRYSVLPHDVDKGDALKKEQQDETSTPLYKYVDTDEVNKILRNAEHQLNESEYKAFSPFDRAIQRNRGQSMHPLTSRVQYLNDGVLPIQYLLLLGESYLPTNADPVNDFYVSPIKAPLNVLAKFPTTRIHVGSVDPLVDDSRRFAALLKWANEKNDVKLLEWDGISHAYIQCPTFLLPQARFSCELAVQWLSQMLDVAVVNRETLKYDYNAREQGLHDATDDISFLRSRM